MGNWHEMSWHERLRRGYSGCRPDYYRTRDLEIIRKKRAGQTSQAIGDDYGITGERVRQIVKKVSRRAF